MKQININGLSIELERKRIKNMYLKILPPDGRLHISAPVRMSEEQINRFILSKLDWIKQHQDKMLQHPEIKNPEYTDGEEIFLQGRRYQLTVLEYGKRSDLRVVGDKIILTVKEGSTPIQRKRMIDRFYREYLEKEIPALIFKWERVIGVRSSGFTIRDMKTRWGTCNIRSKNICINLQLAKKPENCLEYVIVHELVHLLEKSHNSVFKSYMDKFLPEWRNIKSELNGKVNS